MKESSAMVPQHPRLATAFALLIGLAGTAHAQDASFEWTPAVSQTRPGDVVHVTDTGGRVFTWKLADIPIADVISRAGLAPSDVTTIAVERVDAPWNGALIGLAVAGTPWLVVCAANDWCYYNEYGAENLLRVTALTTAAIGAGVGALIDLSVRKRMTLFRKASGGSVRVSPDVAPARAAVRVSVAF